MAKRFPLIPNLATVKPKLFGPIGKTYILPEGTSLYSNIQRKTHFPAWILGEYLRVESDPDLLNKAQPVQWKWAVDHSKVLNDNFIILEIKIIFWQGKAFLNTEKLFHNKFPPLHLGFEDFYWEEMCKALHLYYCDITSKNKHVWYV